MVWLAIEKTPISRVGRGPRGSQYLCGCPGERRGCCGPGGPMHPSTCRLYPCLPCAGPSPHALVAGGMVEVNEHVSPSEGHALPPAATGQPLTLSEPGRLIWTTGVKAVPANRVTVGQELRPGDGRRGVTTWAPRTHRPVGLHQRHLMGLLPPGHLLHNGAKRPTNRGAVDGQPCLVCLQCCPVPTSVCSLTSSPLKGTPHPPAVTPPATPACPVSVGVAIRHFAWAGPQGPGPSVSGPLSSCRLS